ncbi:MAG: large conductance mechanosensitive channel protein MscL [Ferruginibacter sp.]
MGFIKEFKDFAIKGNVVDLAVAVVIGAAFGKIVDSLVSDVITPLILQPALVAAHLTRIEDYVIFDTVRIGVFIAAIINFLFVAISLFIVIKAINKIKKKEETTTSSVSSTDQLLMEIRDSLKK